jgi:hypothetical protein
MGLTRYAGVQVGVHVDVVISCFTDPSTTLRTAELIARAAKGFEKVGTILSV